MSSSADKLVFDLSSEIESSTNVFVKKDWINILDNMNQNYASNQSVIDTSQLSNSNKYMSYREAYLIMPLLLTITNPSAAAGVALFSPSVAATSCDYSIGLKSWYGQIIHSFTLDYQGTTVIQQTPYINMYNSFRLLTSMSFQDVLSQGSTIGFYPDDPLSFQFNTAAAGGTGGTGTCNNMINPSPAEASPSSGILLNSYNSSGGNIGALKRIQYINYDPDAVVGGGSAYSVLQTAQACNNLWKSYIINKLPGTNGTVSGVFQIAITATIYLKHIHSFFAMCPLLKGVFLKMTMNLNNTSANFTSATASPNTTMALTSVSNAVGGCCPFLVSGQSFLTSDGTLNQVISHLGIGTYIASVSVGATCLNTTQAGILGIATGTLARSVYLYVPAYTFNPVFEQAYLSSPIKQICYTDVYQYQVLSIGAGSQFNNLLTNGIANIKSVLIIPFYSSSVAANTGLPIGIPVFQSPFDTAGSGTTSPLCHITNFNVVVSGQNAIYNTQMRGYEQFNNQLYGTNAVNGGLTDGMTSGLISSLGFETSYCYYYVDVGRMLPVEESVPKSVQIIGTNQSARSVDYYCFISYEQKISIDILTGSRV